MLLTKSKVRLRTDQESHEDNTDRAGTYTGQRSES